MTSVVAGVKGRLVALEGKLREARGRVDPRSHHLRELGPMKSMAAGIQSRCREQKSVAAQLVAETRVDRHQLAAKVAFAEERAEDLVLQLEQVKDCVQELQAALYAAERAAAATAAPL